MLVSCRSIAARAAPLCMRLLRCCTWVPRLRQRVLQADTMRRGMHRDHGAHDRTMPPQGRGVRVMHTHPSSSPSLFVNVIHVPQTVRKRSVIEDVLYVCRKCLVALQGRHIANQHHRQTYVLQSPSLVASTGLFLAPLEGAGDRATRRGPSCLAIRCRLSNGGRKLRCVAITR